MSSYASEEEVWKLPEQDFTWDVTSELALYQALLIHKPAGINKHFSVALVSDRLTEELGKEVLPSSIWKKLKSMFDLRAVEDREDKIPFSLEVKEFRLPRKDFETLILNRQCDWREKSRSRYFMSRTPSTPKSEGSESRSSPYHRDLDIENSDDDDDIDYDLVSDDEDDDHFAHLEVESNKSDGIPETEDDEHIRDLEKDEDEDDIIPERREEGLNAEAREEIIKKLNEKLREDEKETEKEKFLDEETENESNREIEKENEKDNDTEKEKTEEKEKEKDKNPEKEVEKEKDKDKSKQILKNVRTEPRTPKEDDKFAPKRHITRSTPSTTPNKRKK